MAGTCLFAELQAMACGDRENDRGGVWVVDWGCLLDFGYQDID